MPWAAIIQAVIQVAGGVAGFVAGEEAQEKAKRMLEIAAREANIPVPQLMDMAAQTLGHSSFDSLTTDPKLRDAQMASLDKLQQIGDEGGLLLADKANLNRISNKVNRDAAGRNAAIVEDMNERGVGGSGAEFAMRTANNQAATQAAADQGMDVAAQAQQRALDAIMGRANMAGQVRGQDWQEGSDRARAQDEIARYNAAAYERAHAYNNSLAQQRYDNQGTAYNRKRAVRDAQMAQATGQGERLAKMFGGTANAVSYGVGQYAEASKKKDDDE